MALVLIVLVVGALAGRASFSHVVDWSMRNLPDGTPRSYGYTNAAVSELLPVGALLFVRFQRKHGRQPGPLAWSMLVGAGLFSVTAQLAVAKPSPSGWLVASVPTLAFMALTKLLLSMKPVAARRSVADSTVHASTRVESPGDTADSGPCDNAPWIQRKQPSDAAPASGRVTARSLTSAGKVAAAVTALGVDAKPAQIAARAGVSVSTARRYMPAPSASPSARPPAISTSTDAARQLAASTTA